MEGESAGNRAMGRERGGILAWLGARKEALALVLGVATAVVGGGWTVFTYLHGQDELKPPTVQVGTGIGAGGDVNISGGTITIGITLEQHEQRLKAREAEIRAELRQPGAQERTVLEAELKGVEQRLTNLQSDYEETKKHLAEATQTLEQYRDRFTAEQFARARDALRQGDLKTAEELFEKAAKANESQAAQARFEVARLAEQRIDYRKALENYRMAATLVPDNPEFLRACADMAHTMGFYAEAGPYYDRALAIQEKALGAEHPEVATTLNNLAGLYHAQGKYAEAEPLYRRDLAISEKALGPEHPSVATTLNNLAGLYRSQGEYAEAEPLYRRALAISEKALGPEHPSVATTLNNLAELYHAQGKYAEAEPLWRRALAIREKALGPEHPDVATTLNNLAELHRAQGKYAEAEPLYRRALAIIEASLGRRHPHFRTASQNFARMLTAAGKGKEARAVLARVPAEAAAAQ
jgi:tetratricopeptide (TPR) repeat protein